MMTAGTGGFSGSAAAKGPVAGFDPVIKMRGKLKSIKKKKCCEERFKKTVDECETCSSGLDH